jgi:hypothetical protein
MLINGVWDKFTKISSDTSNFGLSFGFGQKSIYNFRYGFVFGRNPKFGFGRPLLTMCGHGNRQTLVLTMCGHGHRQADRHLYSRCVDTGTDRQTDTCTHDVWTREQTNEHTDRETNTCTHDV